MSLLALEDVHFHYGSTAVLAGITLAVGRGEVVALVGPNGAGKTTLLRVAGALLRPSRGRVRVEGTDLAAMPRRAAARLVAGVPAEEGEEFPFTVRETVALGRHPWRSAFQPLGADEEAAIDAALAATEMTPFAGRAVPALSSGERRRAALARCLVQDASVLLLDEPTAHLDLGHGLRVLEIVRAEAHRKQKAVLAALHDLNLAALVADRLVLLVDGRIAAEGTPHEVLTEANIRDAFGARVSVVAHPERDVPVLLPLDPRRPASRDEAP